MADLLGIQIIGVLFGAFMLYYTFLHYKRKEFKKIEYAFWLVFWVLFLIVTIVPEILDPIVKTLNFARTLDVFIILGFLFLIGITFYMYTMTKVNQNKLEKVVREVALERVKKK